MATGSRFGLGIPRPGKVGELVEPDARVHLIAMHWAILCMSCCVGALPPSNSSYKSGVFQYNQVKVLELNRVKSKRLFNTKYGVRSAFGTLQ